MVTLAIALQWSPANAAESTKTGLVVEQPKAVIEIHIDTKDMELEFTFDAYSLLVKVST